MAQGPGGERAVGKAGDGHVNVKVFVRCRPLSEVEAHQGRKDVIHTDASTVQLKAPGGDSKTFTFDQVFGPASRQEDVYRSAAAPLVEAALQGYTACVFAYGQTGCGKTHTMEGREAPPEERGIIPRAFEHIFQEIQKGSADREFLVHVSHLEIYCEEIRDLLSKDPRARLDLRESTERGVYVRGLREFVVRSAAEMAAVLQVGTKNRSTGATLMNQDSSRSHSIFTIIIETVAKHGTNTTPASSTAGSADGADQQGSAHPQQPTGSASPAKQGQGGRIRVGKLHLVDLAGSERQSKTQASGERLKEAAKINLSLSALGNVIAALTGGASSSSSTSGALGGGGSPQHIPYRDSKLTRLLQDSLGGNSRTVMVANIGPGDYSWEETMSTLRYASRAKFIKNQPRINEDPKDAMLREFQEEIARLKAQLAERQQAGAPGAAAGGMRTTVVPGGSPGSAFGAWEARAAAMREALRSDIERQLKQVASVDALARARQALEHQAQARLAAEAAGVQARDGERQRVAAALAGQQAELAAALADIESQQQERLELEARIKAMESKVLRGGENLLTKVEALEAAAAAHAEALVRQRVAQAEQERRLAALEEAASSLEGRYSSVAEEVAAKASKLQRVRTATAAMHVETAKLAKDCQAERERLLEDIRSLNKQVVLKDLIIEAYIPPEYQQAIMSRCRWVDGQQRWAVDHIEWAGNLVAARREAEASLSSSEASGSSSSSSTGVFGEADDVFGGLGRVMHGGSGRLADTLYFSGAAPALPCNSGTPPTIGLAGRPRTAAMQQRQLLSRSLTLGVTK